MKKWILAFLFAVSYLTLAYDHLRLRKLLADYQDVRTQALCAHATIVNEGRHAK